MNERLSGPDPLVDSDRLTGSTPPESGMESANVTGRPVNDELAQRAFHPREESPDVERERFDEREARAEGGSYDALAPPHHLPSE